MTQRNRLKLSLVVLHHGDVWSSVFNWTTGGVSVAPRALPKISWYLRIIKYMLLVLRELELSCFPFTVAWVAKVSVGFSRDGQSRCRSLKQECCEIQLKVESPNALWSLQDEWTWGVLGCLITFSLLFSCPAGHSPFPAHRSSCSSHSLVVVDSGAVCTNGESQWVPAGHPLSCPVEHSCLCGEGRGCRLLSHGWVLPAEARAEPSRLLHRDVEAQLF